jgi:HAL2 family 3'(2'),5'-bisphosphate nucleotidase
MGDYTRMLSAAVKAVADACVVCREVQRNMAAVRAITKEDKSPVTVADFGSQGVVAHRLQERLGSIVLVGEETSAYLRNPEHASELSATLAAVQTVWEDANEQSLIDAIDVGAADTHHAGYWTLDPIDGTKGFLRGGQYAVSLAYVERGEVVLGVLGSPNLARDFDHPLDQPDKHGCIYFALKNNGAFELPADSPGDHAVQLQPPMHEGRDPIRFAMSVEEAHSDQSVMGELARRLGPGVEPLRLDSQAKYAVVARGQGDAYIRIPSRRGGQEHVEWIWDHAAGAIIAAEAGCAVTDVDGRALDFSHGRRLTANRGIIAAPPAVHGQVLGELRTLGVSRS